MFSIDQNCHPLWDVVPKLQALAARGREVVHYVEDLDAAFTAVGAAVGAEDLRLTRERFYRGGGADWGAAVFYSEFLGRLAVDVRRWEPFTGLSTKALAKELGRSVDELYDNFSPGDNWQLVGPSYVGDRRRHRLIGDLTVRQAGPFLREIVDQAAADTDRAFPQADSQRRLAGWFGDQRRRLDELLRRRADGRLADLYGDWLGECVGEPVGRDVTSRLFAVGAGPDRGALAEVFLRDYARAAALYNEAVAETDVGVRPLRTAEGELPLFAAYEHAGHRVRSVMYLDGGSLRVGDRAVALGSDRRLPVEGLRRAGVQAVAGKAVCLVIQVRLAPGGAPLVVPYRGSLYLPAAHRLAAKLSAGGLLSGRLHPLMRIRFRLLDRLGAVKTRIRLPAHLAAAMGAEEIPAARLAEAHPALAEQARRRLERLRDADGRRAWQREAFGELFEDMADLDARRRRLARQDPKSAEVRRLSHRSRDLRREVLRRTLHQIATDWQVRDLDYWDSRGALLPWCLALGGEGFYNDVLRQAELYEEGP
jgi:hypothetical protein